MTPFIRGMFVATLAVNGIWLGQLSPLLGMAMVALAYWLLFYWHRKLPPMPELVD